MLNIIINGQGPEPQNMMYVSGGTTRLIEIMKGISQKKNINLYVVSSESVCNSFVKNKLVAHYQISQSFVKNATDGAELLIDSMFRTIRVCFFRLPVDKGIIYSPSDFLWDVFPAFVWKLRNNNLKWVQIIHHLYDNPFKRKGKNFLANSLGFFSQRLDFILIKRRADLIIVVNSIMRQQLSKMGFNEKKIFVNYNGVDLKKIRSFQPSIRKYDCAFLGRLNVSKGIFDLLRIWKNVIAKNPHTQLAIIGGGDKQLEQISKNKITENKLEKNVDVLGYLEDKEAFPILKSSKIFIFPSHEEGFGIAVLEAMACGLPVIAWNLPVFREVFPQGMIIVPIGNFEEFAEEILKLLEDSALRNSISKDALDIASKYSWDEIAKQEMLLIESLQE